MLLTFSPVGQEPEEYVFEPGSLMSAEAEAIEDIPGAKWDTFEEFGVYFLKGNARAQRAALWVMKKRKNPELKFKDLSYPIGALRVSFTDTELSKFKESLESNPDLDEDQREFLVNGLGLGQHSGPMSDGTDLKEPSPNSGDGDSTSVTQDSLPGLES